MVDVLISEMDADEESIEEPSVYVSEFPDQQADSRSARSIPVANDIESLTLRDEDELPGNGARLFAPRTSAMPKANRTWQQALTFAQGQHFHPTSDWYRMCQAFCHDCYGEPAYYGTAYLQWLGAPAAYRHVGGDPDSAPVGSLLCFKGSDSAGHIMLAARPFANGTAGAWSNDLVRSGKIDKVARTAPITQWGHKFLGWIWTVNRTEIVLPSTKPTGNPVVYLDWIVKAAHRDPGAKQGHQTAPAQVKRVETALHAEGLLSAQWANDGSFGSTTIRAYEKWQHRLGYTGRDANGIPGMTSLRKLGQRHGFNVR